MSEEPTPEIIAEEELVPDPEDAEDIVSAYKSRVYESVFTDAVRSGNADMVRVMIDMDIGLGKDSMFTVIGYDYEAGTISFYQHTEQSLLSVANEEITDILQNSG